MSFARLSGPATGPELLPAGHTFAGLRRNHAGLLLADPAWSFETWSEKGTTERSAGSKYQTMTTDEICAMPVRDIVADDCALALWITAPFMVIGDHVRVNRAWGFEPSALLFVWIKVGSHVQYGRLVKWDENVFRSLMGLSASRQNAEFVILGRRGSPKRMSAKVRSIIAAPELYDPDIIFSQLREHSRKPDEQYPRIEELFSGPYVEINARQQRAGWDAWGDQVEMFGTEAAE